MESISLRHVISATQQTNLRRTRVNPEKPFHSKRFHLHNPTARFQIHSRLSEFRDYAKPSRLFQATEVNICTDISVEKSFLSLQDYETQALYKVKLGTSNVYGSGLSDVTAGILLCMIDENGDSILQRIPSNLRLDDSKEVAEEIIQFQRGSFDEFTFKGPKLKNIEAVWISLESGQWRLGSVNLTVIYGNDISLEESQEIDGEKPQYVGFDYNFQAEDILLGERSDSSMVELRPCLITKLYGVDPFTMLTKTLPESSISVSQGISNEETMREYADLKFSLLLYDAILVLFGTSVASFSVGENAGSAFLTGGIGGFLYLLLLQRSVDGLPAPESFSVDSESTNQMFGGTKGPLLGLALAFGLALFTVKYSSGDVPMVFTPKEVLAGMVGFLACKVAVVLAAIKPMTIDVNIKE
ncbi:uncharacterized protein LOC126787683 [Argentina anserina]|uniref:uncharacterized protein LOC126787683 n=1 Tax=Argentina anserina TaxID=57926 RepID=UPI0021763538|nr:uncharacterized protein LOC126787683 [Potentilla anserina]